MSEFWQKCLPSARITLGCFVLSLATIPRTLNRHVIGSMTSITYFFVLTRMTGCHIRIPLGRTPSPFCGTCTSLSYKSVVSYPILYCNDILDSGVYLDVGLTDQSQFCEDLWQTSGTTVTTAYTMDRFLGTDTVVVVFITRSNMGTWARAAKCRGSINKPCS